MPAMSEIKATRAGTRRKRYGFELTSGVLQPQIRRVGESRGFAVSRLLTQWAEIVGEGVAQTALPVKVSYGQGGFGATLTILTTGANAPMLQADLPRIKEKVNSCYGYAAISRIRITQTAPTGFSEGQVAFSHAPIAQTVQPDPKVTLAARAAVSPVHDDDLRTALEALGENILSRTKS